jgi:hypothetical protein
MSTAYVKHYVNAPELETVKFRFQINGTSDPDFALPKLGITDVVRSGAGVFAVTFDRKYPTMVGLTGNVMGDDGVSLGLAVQAAVTDYVAATGVLTVRTVDPYTDATPAAADPTDNDWVYLEVTFSRTTALVVVSAI